VEEYLAETERKVRSSNLKSFLLFGMQYQPWSVNFGIP